MISQVTWPCVAVVSYPGYMHSTAERFPSLSSTLCPASHATAPHQWWGSAIVPGRLTQGWVPWMEFMVLFAEVHLLPSWLQLGLPIPRGNFVSFYSLFAKLFWLSHRPFQQQHSLMSVDQKPICCTPSLYKRRFLDSAYIALTISQELFQVLSVY